MDTVTQNTAQISLFGDDELPIVEDVGAAQAAPLPIEESSERTAKPAQSAQDAAERAVCERDAARRREKFLAKQAWEARKPVVRRVRNRWENAYD